MQVESSATPLLTEDKATSFPGQFCPFHPLSTLELVEKAQGFFFFFFDVYCPEKMCFIIAPASEWKEDIEWIAQHIHSDVKQRAAQLVCDCSNKLVLWKSKQPWSQDRMFLTCYKRERNFFMWIDQPISHSIKERLSYSPQPRVARFHPYGKIKEMFEKHYQEAKQKAFIQHHRHTRKYDEGFEMCDNGFNSLGSPTILHGLRYREWVHCESMGFIQNVCPKKEDSPDHPDPTLSLKKNNVLRQAYYKYELVRKGGRASPRKLPSVKDFVWKTHWRQTRTFSTLCHHPRRTWRDWKQRKLPSYQSKAIVQDARRSKCINMLYNIRNPRSSVLF